MTGRVRVLGGVGFVLVLAACSKSGGGDSESAPAATGSTGTVTGRLEVQADDAGGTPPKLDNQKVEMQSSAGQTVGTTYTDAKGNYTFNTGQLNTSTSSLAIAASSYVISSIIDHTAGNKVLGLKKTITLDPENFVGGVYDVGASRMTEIGAIRGVIKFINADGTDNPKVSTVGAEAYLVGKSFFAKTGDEGVFLLLYVPAGEHTLRIEKGRFAKEQKVTVLDNKTLSLGDIKVQTDTDAPASTASRGSTDFKNAFCVSLATSESDATLFYTTDGANPVASDTFKYPPAATSTCGGTASCPICVKDRTTTLKYFAVDPAGNVENVKIESYVYNERWADPADTTAPSTTLTVNGTTVAPAASPYAATETDGALGRDGRDWPGPPGSGVALAAPNTTEPSHPRHVRRAIDRAVIGPRGRRHRRRGSRPLG